MRRALVLGMLVAVGALSMVVSGQAPAGPSAKAIAATKIEKVKDNLYIITGSGADDMDGLQRRQRRRVHHRRRRHAGGHQASRAGARRSSSA